MAGRLRLWALLAGVFVFSACGTVDPGERSLARWRQAPDAKEFGTTIHPLLFQSCAAAGCHGRQTSFTLQAADPLQGTDVVNRPADLPETLREDYFTVLAYSDLDIEEQSPLVVWGSGQEPAHPGQEALSQPDRESLIRWLEGEE